MKIIKSIAEYLQEMHIAPPRHPFFCVGRHQDSLATMKRKIGPLKHELYSISITNQVIGNFGINNVPVKSNLFIISPFKIIDVDISGQHYEGIYIFFSREFISSNQLWCNFLADFPFFRYNTLVTRNPPAALLDTIYSYLEKIYGEYQQDTPDKFELIKGYMHIILLMLKRHYGHATTMHSNELNGSGQLLAGFESLLLTAVGDPESYPLFRKPSFYAARLNVHINHLNAVIKQLTGKTTSVVIQEHIVQQAGILLRQQGETIKGVAAHFGFCEPGHFASFFKKNAGLTPRKYQSRRGG